MVVLDENFNTIHEKKLSVSNEEIYNLEFDSSKNELYVVANFGIFKINKEPFAFINLADEKGYKTCTINDKNEIWVGTFSSTAIYQKGKKNKMVLPKRTYSICFDKKNQAWLGTVEGLFFCKNRDCEKIPIPELHRDIRDLKFDDDGTLWIATQSNGIFLYKNKKVLQHFTAQNGLSSNNCNRILHDNETAWIATNNGISKINTQDFSIEIIRKDNGLPTNDVKFLHAKKDKIYAATSQGLAVFEKSLKAYSQPPHLSFTSVQIKNQDTLILPKYNIPHHQNNIKINFNGTTFKNAKEVQYEYKMNPTNKEWVSSNTNSVSFPALPYGEYDFLVRAKSLNSDWSAIQAICFWSNQKSK